jgi:citrate synthase
MAEGLEGVVATSTRLSHVDGEAGRLTLAGYAVEDLAPQASFEEVAYLFLHGRLPQPEERARFAKDLAGRRALPRAAVNVLADAAAAQAPPMDALRMAAALLSLGRPGNPLDDALTAIAAFPTIVATYWRMCHGQAPVAVRTDLTHAAHYLHQLSGEPPSAGRARALETYLNTVSDHGLNASTFAARVIVSTQSDVISAITGAVGALKGLLHGGAPGPALDMVFEVGAPDRAETIIRARLDRGERLMGFGHRVYRVRDPRADVLGQAVEQLFAKGGGTNSADRDLYRAGAKRRAHCASTAARA